MYMGGGRSMSISNETAKIIDSEVRLLSDCNYQRDRSDIKRKYRYSTRNEECADEVRND